MSEIIIPGKPTLEDDVFTISKARAMGLDEQGLVNMINDLSSILKDKESEIVHYKSIIQTIEGFGEDMVQMGQTILDFSRSNPLKNQDSESPFD